MIWKRAIVFLFGDRERHRQTLDKLKRQKEAADKLAKTAKSGAAIMDQIIEREERHA